MAKLNDRDRGKIIELLEKGEDLPLDYKHVLFPPEKKEYELVYTGKEREEDILADTMAVPLQPIKTFGKNGGNWSNKLIFGDNLQVMKSLLDDPEVKGRVKLIYIDPPFATKQEFKGSQDQKAYQDKIAGAKFVEFLRKRLIFLRELLTDDGNLIFHLDTRKIHYSKVILDEIFSEHNFVNEIIWHKGREGGSSRSHGIGSSIPTEYQNLLIYSKNKTRRFWKQILGPYKKSTVTRIECDDKGWYYTRGRMGRKPAEWELEAGVSLKTYVSKDISKTKDQILKEITSPAAEFVAIGDVWNNEIIKFSTYNKYPTEKPESLLFHLIRAGTKEGDIVLDAFAGSGTTLAVAEKLGRRWIGIDCGKLAIYTMQKRLLNLKSAIGNKGKALKSKPFTLYHAGLYDFSKLKQLPLEEWRRFALLLFNCRDERHTLSGIELDGYKGRSDVLVFDYQKEGGVVLDYGFIDDLHSMIDSKVGKQFFIIAPAASVTFLEDYIDKGSVRYYILRIPYSIINELHNKDFEAIKQPIDETQVNDTVDAVGFDFIRQPKVECTYSVEKPKGQPFESATIKINTFRSEAMLKGASQRGNLESLSMVMVDFSYDGDIFNPDKVYYASDIEKNGWKVNLPVDAFEEQIMIIYLDIYGNEYREVKSLKDFSGSKRKQKGGK
ncbi:MAG TPA: site-specific DNA-methyltransferase [Smithella sp.]|nr:site-specific DNA-methyltransferase [Smithella sp.]